MNLGELIAGLPVRPAGARTPDRAATLPPLRVCDITEDSRTVVPGSLFVARVGSRSDGRKFVGDAVAAGAVAVLTDDATPSLAERCRVPLLAADDLPRTLATMAERFYGGPTARLVLIGITGTNGKTTTAHLTHQILNGAGVRCGLIGTVMVDDGVAIGPATLTTPPATELSRTFGVMVEAGCKAAVMESSSHALEQGRVSALHYDIAVFTNLTGDHLDYHGTMESYGAAKARLFESLEPDGWAIVNAEDPWHARMLERCRARVIRCSVRDSGEACPPSPGGEGGEGGEPSHKERSYLACATVRAMSITGARVRFEGPWGGFETTTRLVGRHNVMNALQALCASWAAGVQRPSLERMIRTAGAPPGRLEPVTGPKDPYAVLVDYAHTDDALRKVMSALIPLVRGGGSKGRLIVVFGCGGDRDKTKRPRMGAAASELADAAIVTSDNPRTERPGDIVDQILAGIAPERRGTVQVEVDRARAIRKAVEMARPGDMVLIAGKGHETEQIMPDGRGGTVRHHFDDREVARAALLERRHPPLKLAGTGTAGGPGGA
jgi:UDP-N-acetylmuramoyl-L-alanyl-D-glutamate--2,6-diaminopimelate ligase